MRILFYISSIEGGGAQRVLNTLANNLSSKLEHDIFVATNLSTEFAYHFEKKIQFIDLEKNVTKKNGIIHYIQVLSSIRRVYKDILPDIVISFQRGMNGMVLLALSLTKAKIICSEHNYFLRKYGLVEDFLMKSLYWKAQSITVLTRHDLKICKKLGKTNVVYMPNPLCSIENLGIGRCKQVLAVGDVDRWETKGFDLLIQAWSKICYKNPEWKLVIAGKGSENSMNYIKGLAKFNDSKNVELLGFRKDILTLMQKSAIFVLSSRFEGLPMALLEAMQAGCCCVSFDCETGPNEIIQNNVNGVLVPNQNVDKLADALEKVISNQKKRIKLTEKSSLSVQNRYSEDYVINRWNILLSLLK